MPREAPKPYRRESDFAHVFEGQAENGLESFIEHKSNKSDTFFLFS